MSREISNSDDVIDSRDVIARIEELEGERESLVEDLGEKQEAFAVAADSPSDELEAADEEMQAAQSALTEWDEENGDELKVLQSLAEEASGSGDWAYGETLIRDSYFEDYAQELAEDIGAVNKDASWPNDHIDWEAAADALKQDYTSVDFDGVTYWIRS